MFVVKVGIKEGISTGHCLHGIFPNLPNCVESINYGAIWKLNSDYNMHRAEMF